MKKENKNRTSEIVIQETLPGYEQLNGLVDQPCLYDDEGSTNNKKINQVRKKFNSLVYLHYLRFQFHMQQKMQLIVDDGRL